MQTPYWSDIYHLDLCILAYQLHCQTIKFSFDPYYEDLRKYSGISSGPFSYRQKVMEEIIKSDRRAFHAFLDPIVSKYERVNPHLPGFAKPSPGQWLLYRAPTEITERIRFLSVYDGDELIVDHPQFENVEGRDEIYCFIGKTGGSLVNRHRSQKSLMGFVLKRFHVDPDNNSFDLHVVFRGSRSGNLTTTFLNAIAGPVKGGNPDWCTDTNADHDKHIAQVGGENRSVNPIKGFAVSMIDTFPSIRACLRQALGDHFQRIQDLDKIHVAGHSLGGALAIHFISACRIGSLGQEMLSNNAPGLGPNYSRLDYMLRDASVITYGAPVAGNQAFARQLSTNGSIKRIWVATDPIVEDLNFTHRRVRGVVDYAVHAGAEFKLNVQNQVGEEMTGPDAHEPMWIRKALVRYHQEYAPIEAQRPVIPFNSFPEDHSPNNPWRAFKTFHEMLPAVRGINPQAFSQLLGENFKADIINYLTFCRDASNRPTMGFGGGFRAALDQFIPILNDARTPAAVLQSSNALEGEKRLSKHEKQSIRGMLKMLLLALGAEEPEYQAFIELRSDF